MLNLIPYFEPLEFYENYINHILNNSHGALSIIWHSGKLTLFQINSSNLLRIIEPVKYSYIIENNLTKLIDFYSFPVNDNYPVLQTNNVSLFSNFEGALIANTLNIGNSTTFFKNGTYDVYILGHINSLNQSNYYLKMSIGNVTKNIPINSSYKELVNGSISLESFKLKNSGIQNISFETKSVELINQSKLASYVFNSGWITGPSESIITNGSANMYMNTSLPNSFNTYFNISIGNNLNEICYGGIIFKSQNEKTGLSIIFRDGPNSTSGGILLSNSTKLNVNRLLYANLKIVENRTYHLDMEVLNGKISLKLNNITIDFMQFGINKTYDGWTDIGSITNYSSIEFVSYDLPFTISNFSLYYSPIIINKVLIRENPPSYSPMILNFTLLNINPKLYKIILPNNINTIFLIFSGANINGWVESNNVYLINDFILFQSSKRFFNSNISSIQGWIILNHNGDNILYVYSKSQVIANFSALISISSFIGIFSFFLFESFRKKRFTNKKFP